MSVTAGRIVEPTPMRAAIARRMSESQSKVPHFYVSTEISTAAIELHLERISAASGARVSMTAALVGACAVALAELPSFNAIWTEEGLLLADEINVGVAIALEGGLIAPALLDCAGLGLAALAGRVDDLVERARAQKLRAAEIMDATFTLSNLGMFDVSSFSALVTPPQVGILAVGRSLPRAIVGEDGAVTTGRVMTATLSADHRAVDGADAARFLGFLKHALEHPEALSHDDAEEPS
jgi:pyruvate dehydrogenase E2 component (dihydrolipoamide acetyltransferase)